MKFLMLEFYSAVEQVEFLRAFKLNALGCLLER
jgi:hypothetical protein